MTFTLLDGRVTAIRPLTVSDSDALREAVERADPFDLRRRFMGSPPPTRILLKLLAEADGVHDAAVGAFDSTGRLVGVAQFDRSDDEPSADVAAEVAKDWQGCGLGTELLRRIATLAMAQGIERFRVSYLADNAVVAKILEESGSSTPLGIDRGQAAAEIDLRKLV